MKALISEYGRRFPHGSSAEKQNGCEGGWDDFVCLSALQPRPSLQARAPASPQGQVALLH